MALRSSCRFAVMLVTAVCQAFGLLLGCICALAPPAFVPVCYDCLTSYVCLLVYLPAFLTTAFDPRWREVFTQLLPSCYAAMDPKTAQTIATVVFLAQMLTAGYFVTTIPVWIAWLRCEGLSHPPTPPPPPPLSPRPSLGPYLAPMLAAYVPSR